MIAEMLAVQYFAVLLQVAEKTVYTIAQKAELQVRASWRFLRTDIATWIREKTAARRDQGGNDE